ncbi:MAG: cofactor assembly of complex C subunit B [Pseudanabaenaceae cyanobacterium SKYGB_i_bin29]|nr:cofactor assembly of complex C subunit B [Pseudanabaenaceae cyanobacterium SKYG29]MDW8421219.1 cofactor assembly of complex C subunit B [Pseudanabaenaceae cyanobacterium SKYGB_i_bin29]
MRLRYLPLAAGTIVGVGLVLNRLFTPDLLPSQARSDALGILAAAMLILVFLLWQSIQPVPPEAVQLKGSDRFYLHPDLPPELQTELAWLSHTLLTLTVTRSVVIWYENCLLLARGILPEKNMEQPGQLVQTVMTKQKPLYLVQLNLYPGKVEFDYLPENTQSVIVQPLAGKGALILGSNVPRSYTNQDEAWITSLAAKLTYSLAHLNQKAPRE